MKKLINYIILLLIVIFIVFGVYQFVVERETHKKQEYLYNVGSIMCEEYGGAEHVRIMADGFNMEAMCGNGLAIQSNIK